MKKYFLTLLFLVPFFAMTAMAHDNTSGNYTSVTLGGAGFGSVLAIVTSWDRNRSVGWAILHGILNWFYVLYYVLSRTPEN